MSTFEKPRDVPQYGFEAPSYVELREYNDFKAQYSSVLTRRYSRWVTLLSSPRLKRGRRLKRFCRKGIPPEKRAEVWMEISGAKEKMEANREIYSAASRLEPPKKIMSVILADIPRTYPENSHFRETSESNGKLHSLQRILTAFAVQFPKVGYCQGFNYIAAILLLVLRGPVELVEEQAFWLLDALVNRMLPPYYADDMVSVRRDCMVLGELLRGSSRDNPLYEVIINSDINFTVLCAKWFICLYADVLPIETTLRIFDCLFYEGEKILFRAGLALIGVHREELLKCREFPELLTTFRNMCRDRETLWCHQFLKAVFSLSGRLSRSKITKLRVRCEQQIRGEQKR